VYIVGADQILLGKTGDADLSPVEISPAERREWTAEADFIAAIRTGEPVTPDFEEGVRYMEVTEAIYRSARSGRAVTLPLEY
jgi:predicted dehydrogenase